MADAPFTKTSYNHHDPDVAQDPYRIFADVRAQCPMGRSEALGGFYFPTTYDGVKRVFSDFRFFTSTKGSGLPDQVIRLLPVDLDPPQHTRWRRVLNRFFTREAADADRPRVQGIADTLIDSFIAKGEADLVGELTRPLLAMTMLPVLGIPTQHLRMLSDKLLWMVHNRTLDHEGWLQRYGEMGAFLTAMAAERRAMPRQDDLLQCLIDEEFDGARLTDEQCYQVLMLTLFGALDSTSSAMSGALYHLALHPADKGRLVSGEVAWADAIEEFLRFTSPIQALRRTVVQPTEVDRCPLAEGDVVLALNGAANRDPQKFPDPDTVRIERDAREHLSFGSGAHVCIGRHFARVMLDVCLRTVLQRLEDYAVVPGFSPEYTPSEARALKSLPVTFTPA
ncbi:MAG: cytochrome P450 [Hyphomonadaceae bacterium]|nr:cytochrome P450 [Hyphomonadaceae bacterium]